TEERFSIAGVVHRDDQERERDQVSQRLGVLAVVDRADTEGDAAQDGGQRRIRRTRNGGSIRRSCSARGSRGGHRVSETGDDAIFAIDHAADVAFALVTERFPASAAERGGGGLWMVGAVHAVLLSSSPRLISC